MYKFVLIYYLEYFLYYFQSLDIDTQLNSIDGSIDLSNFEILTPDLQSQLNDLKSAVNINFTAFYAEVCYQMLCTFHLIWKKLPILQVFGFKKKWETKILKKKN